MKAQITIFIIISLIILTVFGFTIYLTASVKTQQQIPTLIDTSHITNYIETCLEQTAKNGLYLLGKQSGFLFSSQGGLTPDPSPAQSRDYITYENIKVPFVIIPPIGNVGQLVSNIPEYPFEGFPYINGKKIFQGYYGLSRLSPLFKQTPDHREVPNSIQENLELFVENNIHNCVNLTVFEKQGYTIKTEIPKTTLILASDATYFSKEDFITFMLDWPIQLSLNEKKTNIKNFAVKIPVRLASTYFFIKNIIDRDTSDITYYPHNEDFFTVTTERINGDSIIIVKDTLSTIEHEPFEFLIARRNRAPALWNIPEIRDGFCVGDKIFIDENNILRIGDSSYQLNATDPDENPIIFKTNKNIFSEEDLPGPLKLRVSASDGILEDYQDLQLRFSIC